MEEGGDLLFAGEVVVGGGGAEFGLDLSVIEVEALDLVVVAATFDGGPVHDAGGGGDGVAQVGLFVDFREAGAVAAVGEELDGFETGATGFVDVVEEAEFDGVGHGDAEVQIPGRRRENGEGRMGWGGKKMKNEELRMKNEADDGRGVPLGGWTRPTVPNQ